MTAASKIRAIAIPILFVSVIAVFLVRSTRTPIPLQGGESAIRSEILHKFPIGTPKHTIVDWMVRNRLKFTESKIGYAKHGGPIAVGNSSIRCLIGERRIKLLFVQSVTGFFGFDEREQLIDVEIVTTTDAF
jgi:hypothetical protein